MVRLSRGFHLPGMTAAVHLSDGQDERETGAELFNTCPGIRTIPTLFIRKALYAVTRPSPFMNRINWSDAFM
jgi:hypothetical protein